MRPMEERGRQHLGTYLQTQHILPQSQGHLSMVTKVTVKTGKILEGWCHTFITLPLVDPQHS